MPDPYYLTTAINYPNGKPHIGHAYEAIAADVIARVKKAQGFDVRLVTGTDEHGLKMDKTARAAGRDTLEFADEMSGYFRQMCATLGIGYSAFRRTTEAQHHAASQALWQAMADAGDLYLDRYEGWYSVRDEAFFAEDELTKGEGGKLHEGMGKVHPIVRQGGIDAGGGGVGAHGCGRVIRGKQADREEADYLFRGIASRQFQRVFAIEDGMEVMGASLRNGLLAIEIIRHDPVHLVRKINISTAE